MTDTAIRVENLGKRYQLGAAKSGSFRESMSSLFRRRIRSESHSATSIQPPASSPPESQPDASIQYLANQQDFWALQDINFEIKRGEAVGIIGRNGAGKSTLLKILSRITEPTKGRFEIFGRVSSLLEVGTGFHPELTGRENVYLNGTILGMKRREVKAKFDEIVAFSGVEKFIDTPVKHYSSGMQVRLAFAVAAHLEPEILIIDEVLAVGDAEFQKKCLGKMEDVTGEGRTVLFVSHNMGAVQALCNRGILLDNGQVRFSGSPKNCINGYLSDNRRVFERLELRPDREGNGEVKIVNISVNHEKKPSNIQYILTGQEVIFKIDYKSVVRSLYGLDISLGFRDANDIQFFVCNSGSATAEFEELEEHGSVFCRIPKFPLLPGKYSVTVNCKVNNKLSDRIYNAISIHVEGGDFFGTGKLPNNKNAGVLVDNDWFSKIEKPIF